ncbi:hypothetical protein JOM56_002929 [Amanita muscaria]
MRTRHEVDATGTALSPRRHPNQYSLQQCSNRYSLYTKHKVVLRLPKILQRSVCNLKGIDEGGDENGNFHSGHSSHFGKWSERPAVNGVASANCEKTMFCLSSDGSQQEGDDAEAVPKTSTWEARH